MASNRKNNEGIRYGDEPFRQLTVAMTPNLKDI